MAPLVGRYFGQSGQQLDDYGANLAAAKLPGQGHRILHNRVQDVIKSMAKLGGIVMEKESANFLIDKVGEPWITRYVTHVSLFPNARKSTYGIAPDLQAFNFPVGRQTVNDSGITSSAEAIFEVKTYTACPSRYNHNNDTIRPADRRGREAVREYRRGFRKLDRQFAADVVGDGDSNVVGPFSAAQGRFFRGQVIPLCAGAVGEIGEDFSKILKTLARMAAASNDGLAVSPLVNSDRKGGAFPIMHQQFRRAIGVALVRGNALHKLARLHYVRATAREAAYTARAHHSENRWRPGDSGGANWFREHTAPGYGVFEQFRNGYDFSVH